MAMAGLSSSDSDSDDEELTKKNPINENKNNPIPDDDKLDQLARINADFNSNNLTEEPLQSKGINFNRCRPTFLFPDM
jgi:hypothetical protein